MILKIVGSFYFVSKSANMYFDHTNLQSTFITIFNWWRVCLWRRLWVFDIELPLEILFKTFHSLSQKYSYWIYSEYDNGWDCSRTFNWIHRKFRNCWQSISGSCNIVSHPQHIWKYACGQSLLIECASMSQPLHQAYNMRAIIVLDSIHVYARCIYL